MKLSHFFVIEINQLMFFLFYGKNVLININFKVWQFLYAIFKQNLNQGCNLAFL